MVNHFPFHQTFIYFASEASIGSDWSAAEGPGWLHTPAAARRAAVWQAIGMVGLARDIAAPEALAVLRGQASAAGRTVDDLAAELVHGPGDPATGAGPDDPCAPRAPRGG